MRGILMIETVVRRSISWSSTENRRCFASAAQHAGMYFRA
jgi:hypothetical protein